MSEPSAELREVVLVGGGHAQLFVLERLAREPLPARVTLLVDTPLAVYSGMLPGFLAGQYRAEELQIDLAALAQRAGAALALGRATGVDPRARVVTTADGATLPYDLASFDVGSTVAGLDTPGVREHALATRPIGSLLDGLRGPLGREGTGGAIRGAVVGGGAAGVELAFTLEHRLRSEGRAGSRVCLFEGGPEILPSHPRSLAAKVRRLAQERGLEIRCGARVAAVHAGEARLASGESLPFDLLLWAAGAASQPLFRDSGLPVDASGFVRTRATLQIEGHDDLFAAGDCAALIDHPHTPKAGVYAVREGPVLADNLFAALAGGKLRRYEPQRDFLTLMNLGGGVAAASKWSLSLKGRWLMALKDRIDRRFVRRFQARA